MQTVAEAVTTSITSSSTPTEFTEALFYSLKASSPPKKVIPAALTYGDWELEGNLSDSKSSPSESDMEECIKELEEELEKAAEIPFLDSKYAVRPAGPIDGIFGAEDHKTLNDEVDKLLLPDPPISSAESKPADSTFTTVEKWDPSRIENSNGEDKQWLPLPIIGSVARVVEGGILPPNHKFAKRIKYKQILKQTYSLKNPADKYSAEFSNPQMVNINFRCDKEGYFMNCYGHSPDHTERESFGTKYRIQETTAIGHAKHKLRWPLSETTGLLFTFYQGRHPEQNLDHRDEELAEKVATYIHFLIRKSADYIPLRKTQGAKEGKTYFINLNESNPPEMTTLQNSM